MDIEIKKIGRGVHCVSGGYLSLMIAFGEVPSKVNMYFFYPIDQENNGNIDIELLLKDVKEGVEQAAIKYSKNIFIEKVFINPNDFPVSGQTKYLSFKIAEQYIKESFTQ